MFDTDLELYGWILAMLLPFICPLIIFLFLKMKDPGMEWKRSIACYIGWIPSNVISCFYLHYSIGIINAFMIFVICQIVQLIFVIVMGRILIHLFGFNAFR